MERVLYVVAREQPLLVGYLRTKAGARPPKGGIVEIKLDERQGERRRARAAHDPERRRSDRRVRRSLADDLRTVGYAVVSSETASARTEEPAPASAWRPRSTWAQRASRRGLARAGLIVPLLVAVGTAIAVGWFMLSTPHAPAPVPQAASPVAPAVAPRIEEASPAGSTPKVEPVAPAAPSPAARPAPPRIVSARAAGVVLTVEPRARMLVVEDGSAAGRLRVEVARDARVVLSERDEQAEDLTHPFKDTAIDLADVKRGDYVVVELRGPEGKELARSVVVTFRPP